MEILIKTILHIAFKLEKLILNIQQIFDSKLLEILNKVKVGVL